MANKVNSTNTLNLKNIILKSAFSNDDFNFIHINPGSLKPHIDELRLLTNKVCVHAIAISESWFNEKTNDRLMAIENYNLLRHDRKNKRGGGVAIYLRNNIKAKLLKKSRANGETEYLFLEIGNNLSENFVLEWCIILHLVF